MKDKLEKTGKTKAYYRLRFATKATLITLATFLLAAIPVGVSYKIAETAKAEENTESSSVVSSEEETSSSPDEDIVLA
jgi:hypothetical protein